MENPVVNVKVTYHKKVNKEMFIPTQGIRFHCNTRFDGEIGEVTWSAFVTILMWGEEEEGNTFYGKFQYFVDEAPHHFLQPDNRFSLYDGPNEVARGVVLDWD